MKNTQLFSSFSRYALDRGLFLKGDIVPITRAKEQKECHQKNLLAKGGRGINGLPLRENHRLLLRKLKTFFLDDLKNSYFEHLQRIFCIQKTNVNYGKSIETIVLSCKFTNILFE